MDISAVAVWDTPETGGHDVKLQGYNEQDSPNPRIYYLRVGRLNSRVGIYEANRTLSLSLRARTYNFATENDAVVEWSGPECYCRTTSVRRVEGEELRGGVVTGGVCVRIILGSDNNIFLGLS